MTGTSATCSAATVETGADAFHAWDAQAARGVGTSTVSRARARLERHAALWRERPLTRDLYHGYHRRIEAELSEVAGLDLEVGAGHGSFAESRPGIVSCDVVPCSWLDCAADATCLPFADGSLANIVMVDVLHHVAQPVRFFDEAVRTLAPGGRIVLLEPYVSPISWIAWRYFHEEGIACDANPLDESVLSSRLRQDDPWDANIAAPTLIFWRYLAAFRQRFPTLKVIRRDRFDMLVMPLSGGFERTRLIPLPVVPLVRAIERVMAPLSPLLAFRCLIVLERTSTVGFSTRRLVGASPVVG
ncbi:MAG: class I SAM-dependent methyltransferase [Planctomycetes bacterium]|nr:class I SAM-dependent methyltransferase [Planctomycetota bacterium]